MKPWPFLASRHPRSVHANVASYSHSTTFIGDTGLRGAVGETGASGTKGDQGAHDAKP